jgi:hypothetical protein
MQNTSNGAHHKKPGPNLNLMTTFLTIFTFTNNITKLKKKIFKTGLCKTRRTKISERSYHQKTGGLAARKRR